MTCDKDAELFEAKQTIEKAYGRVLAALEKGKGKINNKGRQRNIWFIPCIICW